MNQNSWWTKLVKKIKFNKINIGRIQTQVYHVEIANFRKKIWKNEFFVFSDDSLSKVEK